MASTNVVLLLVLHSSGSSPGRQGFKMAVAADGSMVGSIGGGIMEHKLVVKSQNMLIKNETDFFWIRQIHRKDSPQNQSGMICSGEQTVVLLPLLHRNPSTLSLVKDIHSNIQNNSNQLLQIQSGQISLLPIESVTHHFEYHFKNESQWIYREHLTFQNRAYIVGGGHVGRALSEQLALLGFHITVLDDREDLNTMESNPFAQEKKVVDYEKIGTHIPEGNQTYVVIMSFGYRSDKVVIRQFLNKDFKYIGMMGSQSKIDQLYAELEAEGISKNQLAHVYSPIGLSIASQTPSEIAVSIAAEMIRVKNEVR